MGPDGYPLTILTDEDDSSRASSLFLEPGSVDTLSSLRASPDVTSTAMLLLIRSINNDDLVLKKAHNAGQRT